jgi:hypothetical protein
MPCKFAPKGLCCSLTIAVCQIEKAYWKWNVKEEVWAEV